MKNGKKIIYDHNSLCTSKAGIYSPSGRTRTCHYGKPDTRIKYLLAGKDASIHKDVVWPEGYDCYVEENGTNVSGGQCQRLKIKRALVSISFSPR